MLHTIGRRYNVIDKAIFLAKVTQLLDPFTYIAASRGSVCPGLPVFTHGHNDAIG